MNCIKSNALYDVDEKLVSLTLERIDAAAIPVSNNLAKQTEDPSKRQKTLKKKRGRTGDFSTKV